MNQVLTSVAAIVAASIIAFGGPWFAVRVALRKQRLFERKLDAYDRILLALNDMLEVLAYDLDAAIKGREISDEVSAANLRKYQDAKREVQRANTLGKYLLKDNVRDSLAECLATLANTRSDWYEGDLANARAAIQKCLQDVIEGARKEVG